MKQNKKYEEDHVSEVHEKKPCKDDLGSDSQSEYTEEEEQCDDTIEKLRAILMNLMEMHIRFRHQQGWPAMIKKDPDGDFLRTPKRSSNRYHVMYFNDGRRSWLHHKRLRPFKPKENMVIHGPFHHYIHRVVKACQACKIPLNEMLEKYKTSESFT